MSKIFLTGMTAPQVSARANIKSLGFAGVLNDVLTNMGHEVTWAEPDIKISKSEADKFDVVLIGLAPITSLGANRAYGALSMVDTLWGSNNLYFFIDAPSVSQIGVALKTVQKSPESLVKEFFSYRKNYSDVKNDLKLQHKILSGAKKLLTEQWPTTIYSALPWSSSDDVYRNLPSTVGKCLVPLNVDAFLLSDEVVTSDFTAEKWVYDLPTPHWTKKLAKNLSLPMSPMKINKSMTDTEVSLQIARSVGALISPDPRQGTWWSYRYVQAMNSLTPVVTDWVSSSKIGPSWSVLGASVEEMSQEERKELAINQKTEYLMSIPSKIEVTETLKQNLNL